MFMTTLFTFLLSILGVYAYIPASPTNNTNDAIQQGLNVSDVSKLQLQWYSDGSVPIPFVIGLPWFEQIGCRLIGPFGRMCHISL
jgi:hypothetical protein